MNECILWAKGKNDERGYGRLSINGKMQYAHRVAYCEHNGVSLADIKGKMVRHTCDNPPCVNPEHLIIGTALQNVHDMVERKRNVRWKLTDEQVASIRSEYVKNSRDYGMPALGRKYGVSTQMICYIVNGLWWKGTN